MPIGPALPPHLQASRGGSPEGEKETAAASSSIGPALPPHLQQRAAAAQKSLAGGAGDDDDSSDDEAGPALPPHILAARKAGVAPSPAVGPQRPPVAGPSRPPAGPSRPVAGPSLPPPQSRYQLDSDSDDDVVGPRPSAPGEDDGYSAVRDFEERERRWAKEREEAAKPKELKREEWMLKPPEASDILSNLDPTKVPKGQTSFARVSAAPVTKEDQSLWTETPAERMQRLTDEVSGKRSRAEVSAKNKPMDEAEADEMRRRKRRDKEIKDEIEAHNSKHRSASLLDQYAKKEKKKGDDTPAPIWDRDLHMSVAGKLMDDKDRNAKIMDAKGLGSRFGHGKSGAFS